MFKRKVDFKYDDEPSKIHRFNSGFIEKYIDGKDVLDIGCWTGQLEKLLVGRARTITGIDPNSDAIAFARKHIEKAKFMVGTVDKLSSVKKKFDAVTLFDVVEHVPSKTEEHLFQRVNNLLREDGRFFLSTPNQHILSILFDPAFFLIGHRHYSIKKLTVFLEKSGFFVEKYFMVGGTMFLLNHLFELIQKHFLKTYIKLSPRINFLINKSSGKGGYAEIYLIARKKRNRQKTPR